MLNKNDKTFIYVIDLNSGLKIRQATIRRVEEVPNHDLVKYTLGLNEYDFLGAFGEIEEIQEERYSDEVYSLDEAQQEEYAIAWLEHQVDLLTDRNKLIVDRFAKMRFKLGEDDARRLQEELTKNKEYISVVHNAILAIESYMDSIMRAAEQEEESLNNY